MDQPIHEIVVLVDHPSGEGMQVESLAQQPAILSELEDIPPLTLENSMPKMYKYKLIHNSEIPGGYNATVDVALENKDDVYKWLDEYSKVTNTAFKVRTSTDKGKKYQCTLRLQCKHNTGGKRTVSDNPKLRNTNCPSVMTIKLFRRDLFFDEQCLIEMTICHNHARDQSDLMRHRRPKPEVDQKLQQLFACGHSATSALKTHITDVLLDNPYNSNIVSDRSIIPDYQYVWKLYEKDYGKNPPKEPCVSIEKAISVMIESGGEVEVINDNNETIVAAMTPLMQRVCKSRETGEIVILDATGGTDKRATRTYLFVTPTIIGGLPLGIIITSGDSLRSLELGFSALKKMMPPDAFGGRGPEIGPKVFISDDCAVQRGCLKAMWPASAHLLCLFHLLQTTWRWLWTLSGTQKEDRHILLNVVKTLLFAEQDNIPNQFMQLQNSAYAHKYPKFLDFCKRLYAQMEDWATFHQIDASTRDIDSDANPNEGAYTVLKDHILDCTRGFTIPQAVHYIVKRLDAFYQQKIFAVVCEKSQSFENLKYVGFSCNIKPEDIQALDDDVFVCPSEKNPTTLYEVNINIYMCTCRIGLQGTTCKHQYAVAKLLHETTFAVATIQNEDLKQRIFHLVTGSELTQSVIDAHLGIMSENSDLNRQQLTENETDDIFNGNSPWRDPSPEPEEEFDDEIDATINNFMDKIKLKLHSTAENPDEFRAALLQMIERFDDMSESSQITAMKEFGAIRKKVYRRTTSKESEEVPCPKQQRLLD